ncbi:hypothetical protein CVT25_007230 [Psilocybe cyanescens]|uniref:DUF6533 domain-containing protein n=1 Tax=Psilocybe cyanescens TaxID=93625 RepID=A0A409XVS7_PSICY|nr:hypothetical protein CVT25_007230 [Psilocybe cyanescens]
MDDMLSLNQKLMQDIVIRKWSTCTSDALNFRWSIVKLIDITRAVSTVASLAVLLYEYIIMLSQEIRYIWRYAQHAYIAAMCLLMAALDSILMLRVYALHNKDRRVGALLVVLFCGQIGVDVHFCVGYAHMPGGVDYCQVRPHEDEDAGYTRRHPRWGLDNHEWDPEFTASSLHIALFTTLAPYALIGQVSKAHMLFGETQCCRMIMNMQTLDVTEGSSTDIENLTELILTELHTLQLELQEQ